MYQNFNYNDILAMEIELLNMLKSIEKFWDTRLGEQYIAVYNDETQTFE